MWSERRVWFLGSHSHGMIPILSWSCLLRALRLWVDENRLRCHRSRLAPGLVLRWTCRLPQAWRWSMPFPVDQRREKRGQTLPFPKSWTVVLLESGCPQKTEFPSGVDYLVFLFWSDEDASRSSTYGTAWKTTKPLACFHFLHDIYLMWCWKLKIDVFL